MLTDARGTSVALKDVRVGDRVLATDPLTGNTRPEKVQAVIRTLTDTDFTDLTVATSGGSHLLTSTQHHPYWDVTRARWLDATDLRTGDALRLPDGRTARIVHVRDYTGHIVTYNLTVQNLHTYYVLAGNNPVLVHNAGGLQDTIGLGSGYSARMDRFPVGQGVDFEMHVYYRGSEVGIYGSNGWFAKHGKSADVSVPENVENRLKGKAIEFMRSSGRIGPRGTEDISGDKWKRPRLAGGC